MSEWRKLNRGVEADVAALVVGARVAARYFDPSGPGSVDSMTTDAGVITRIDGDPLSWEARTVWMRPDTRNGVPLRWYEVHEIDYFGGDLYLPAEDLAVHASELRAETGQPEGSCPACGSTAWDEEACEDCGLELN